MWAVALTLAAFLGAHLARSLCDAATRPVGIRRVDRTMRACKNFGRSGETLGSNPHFGVILAFLGRRASERRGVCTGTGSVACVSKLAPQFTGEVGLGLNWH